ncbi:MAG: O-antigen ligase family protein [Anaerolineae bacterium]|nr:O-antigen ligase family protein [Anaerolineae bacterium]
MAIAILLSLVFGALVVLSPYLPVPSAFQKLILVIPFIFTLAILINNLERLILFIIAVGIPLNLDISIIISPLARNVANIASGRTIVALTELRISLIMIIVIAGYLLWLVGRRGMVRYPIRYFPSITIPAIGLIVISLLSITQAQDTQLAFFKIMMLIELFLIYFYVANHLRTKSDLQFFMLVFMGALLAESILMVLQWQTGWSFSVAGINAIIDPDSHRAAGTLGTANSAGVVITGYLALTCAMFWLFPRRTQKVFAVICFVCGCVALISTAGRAAWGGFIVAFLAFILIGTQQGLVSRKAVIWLFLALILISGLFYPVISQRLTANDSGSAASRLVMAKLAWNVIRSSPTHFFIGVGANNYALIAPAYYSTDVGRLGYIIDSSVHNAYLLAWAETGLIGLIFYLIFLFTPLLHAWKNIFSHDRFVSLMALGLGCALLAIYIQMLVDPFIARPKMIIVWLLIALIASLDNMHPSKISVTKL